MPEGPWKAFAEAGVLPDLAQLHFIVRAITPPRRPRRFDARFFAADASAIAHRVDGKVGPDSELVELVWLPIPEAKKHDLPTITQVALDELEGHASPRGSGTTCPRRSTACCTRDSCARNCDRHSGFARPEEPARRAATHVRAGPA